MRLVNTDAAEILLAMRSFFKIKLHRTLKPKLTECFFAVAPLCVLATSSLASSHNEVTVWSKFFGPSPLDRGGDVERYVAAVAAANEARTLVVIEGTCESACTIKLAAKYKCVRPNAILWFHSATAKAVLEGEERSFVSVGGNETLLRSYPPQVRHKILLHHMLDNTEFDPENTLTGRELIMLGEKECAD
ncbi:MAG TPA: hypothetical protein VIF02_16650 [Methylocella sp.]|jgi:hypothetical protein